MSASRRLLWVAVSVLLVVIMVGPVLALLPDLALVAPGEVVEPARHLPLLAATLSYTLAVTLACVLLAVLAGSLIWNHTSAAMHPLAVCMLALVALPPYLHALSWQSITDLAGLPFAGWVAAWWVQVMALSPIATGAILLGLAGLDNELVRVARTQRGGLAVLSRIVVPLITPAMSVAGAGVFLLTLTDYSVAQSFRQTPAAFEIFAEFAASHDAGRATWLALPLIGLALPCLPVLTRGLSHLSLKRVGHTPAALDLPFLFRVAQVLAAVCAIVLPGLAILTGLTLRLAASGATAIGTPYPAIVQSIALAAVAAALAVPLGFAAAHRMQLPGRFGRIWRAVLLLPLALPAPLIGIGLVTLWNHDVTAWVYDAEPVIILTYLARFLPLSALIAVMALARLDRAQIDVARVLAPTPWHTWMQVRGPMLLPIGSMAGFLVFVLSLSELPASLLTAPPGTDSLAALIYGYLHYGASDRAAALGLALPCLALGVAAVLWGLTHLWGNLLPPASKESRK